MAMEPDILLMDEPFAALDALTRRKMQEELLQLWDDIGFTMLFVTHSIEEAIIVGNRILVLSPHPGQVRAELNSTRRGRQAAAVTRCNGASTTCCSPTPVERNERARCAERPRDHARRCGRKSSTRSLDAREIGEIARPLSLWERLANITAVRRLLHPRRASAALWQAYAVWLDNPLIFPTFADTVAALWAWLSPAAR